MKKLFLIATGQDTAGWNWRIHDGFRRLSKTWVTRSMAATRNYLDYPTDLTYDKGLLLSLYRDADAIHLQNQLAGWQLYDRGAGKPTVLQHHGTIFREQHEIISRAARKLGVVEICSTIDLTLYEPGVTWIPIPYNQPDLERIRCAEYEASDVIRIAHAPTNRAVKGTDHFLSVIDRLRERFKIELILIEGMPWAECLRLKARADIFYDQLDLGYGCNAIEAWGMGMPVVAGAADPQVRAAMLSRWGTLPFAEATPQTLEKVLGQLVRSKAARQEYAEIGRQHFGQFHDEEVVVPMLEAVYASARRTRPGPLNRR